MSSGGYQPCWIISIIQGLTAGSVALSRFFWRHKDRIGWRTWFFWGKDRRTCFFERQENMRTCFCFEDMRTWEHVFVWKDRRTWEHVVGERQKNRRTGFWKTEEWVSVGGYGIPAIPTQTWVYKPIEWWQSHWQYECTADWVGMAGMPYPPTISELFTLLLLNSLFTLLLFYF